MGRALAGLRSAAFVVFLALTVIPWGTAAVLYSIVARSDRLYWMCAGWLRVATWGAKAICGVHARVQGRENLPDGAVVMLSKHQSTWETFAMLAIFEDPAFIMKRELMWIPGFGWYAWKGGMVAINRSAGSAALVEMTRRAKTAVQEGRQIIIYPEGTRRPPGAAPAYKFGIAHLYSTLGVPCLPVALNSGLFWPRRTFLRRPGTIVVEFLEPLPPGLPREEFFQTMKERIETASDRLLAEGPPGLTLHAGEHSASRSPSPS